MSRDWLLYLDDLIDSAEKIGRHLAGKTLESFTSDQMVFDAVLFNLHVIGEAAKKLPADARSTIPEADITGPARLRDLIARIGADFWRLRLGIGHPGDRDAVLDYVLGRPPAAEAALIHEAVLAAADAVPVMLTDGAQKAMSRLHARGGAVPSPPRPA